MKKKRQRSNSKSILDRMKRYNIKQRSRRDVGLLLKHIKRDLNSVKGNRKNYLEIAKNYYKWECMICFTKHTNDNFDLVVHHKDGNNKPSNLQVLCQSCHINIHRREMR